MAIIRRSNNWLPGVFNDFFGNEWMENCKSVPAINIQQSDDGFTVEVAAPGMTKEDCVVRLNEDNNLLISFEKQSDNEERDKRGAYLRREFTYSKFQRTMVLPDNIDQEKISAKVENGVLTVDIPTLKESKVLKEKLINIE